MKKYIQTYFEESGIDPHGYIPCEVCSHQAVDIHHIDARGMGGSKMKDGFENLMALCRTCHESMGDKKLYKAFLKRRHAENFPEKLEYIEYNGRIKKR